MRPVVPFLLLALPVWAQDSGAGTPKRHGVEHDPAVRKAIGAGLAWLARVQAPSGAWICKIGYKLNDGYYGRDGEHVGVTSIACMAFMANGSLPDRGPYARQVRSGLDFVLRSVREEDGYITANGSRMYSHAFATLFLAHAYGTTQRADVRTKLRRAVKLLEQAQNPEGGWRYQPQPVDADISVTVTVLQALRAARDAGIAVSSTTIERAMKYVDACATPWGYRYQSLKRYRENDGRHSYALTAAGVVSSFSAGQYGGRNIRNALLFLDRNYDALRWGKFHFFYGHYYACQAFYIRGGDAWERYYGRLKNDILRAQNPEGYWSDDVGPTYATAMACLLLALPTEWFPIFQK